MEIPEDWQDYFPEWGHILVEDYHWDYVSDCLVALYETEDGGWEQFRISGLALMQRLPKPKDPIVEAFEIFALASHQGPVAE